jgi:hypothetical protein
MFTAAKKIPEINVLGSCEKYVTALPEGILKTLM